MSRPHSRPDHSPSARAGDPAATQTPPSGHPERAVARDVAASGDVASHADLEGSHVAPRFDETWAVEAAASLICRRWKPAILWSLGAGPRRYNALAALDAWGRAHATRPA